MKNVPQNKAFETSFRSNEDKMKKGTKDMNTDINLTRSPANASTISIIDNDNNERYLKLENSFFFFYILFVKSINMFDVSWASCRLIAKMERKHNRKYSRCRHKKK